MCRAKRRSIPAEGPSYKLASNENPLGASPKARAIYAELAAKLEIYPDGRRRALKAAIAKKHGLDASRIVVGAGSDEIFLLMLGRAYLAPGDESDLHEARLCDLRDHRAAAGRDRRRGPGKTISPPTSMRS